MAKMQQHFPQQDTVMGNVYMPPQQPQQPVAARPATPIPSKRPGSWGKRLSLENLRPKKKTSVYGSPASEHEAVPPVPAMYADMMHASVPTSMPAGYELPMRMGHHQQGYTSNPGFMPQHQHQQQQQQQFGSPTSFYLDDGDMRL